MDYSKQKDLATKLHQAVSYAIAVTLLNEFIGSYAIQMPPKNEKELNLIGLTWREIKP